MMDSGLVRRIRGAIGNAMVWGACWGAAALGIFTVLRTVGLINDTVSWLDGVGIAVRFAVVGGITGGAFSAIVPFAYRGRRLAEISWVRFGIAGGAIAGIFVPLFLQGMNLLSGDGMVPWRLVTDDSIWTALFGGVAAAGSLRIAQRAERLAPAADVDGLADGGVRDTLPAPTAVESIIPRRAPTIARRG